MMHLHGSSAVVNGELKEQTCIKANSGLITSITFNCSENPDSFHAGTLIPGFVDIHSHGGAGFYFSDLSPENVAAARNIHLSHGTTSHIASLVSEPIGVLEEQILRLVPMVNAGVFEGIHLEGPYLAHARCGFGLALLPQRTSPLCESIGFANEQTRLFARTSHAL